MADFRKWILLLAVVTLFASLASAQTNINCQTSGGVPLIVRAEGTAELTGDVVLTCTGGVGVPAFPINFQIFLNTDITSKLLTSASYGYSSGATEALLLVGEPSANAAIIGTNAYRGFIGAGGQNLQWNGIQFTPPGTGSVTLRFTNIRANATKIPSAGIPNPITAYISVSSPTAITLTSNQVNVAVPQPSYSFSISSGATALQCLPKSLSDGYQFSVTFKELFASAFKTQIEKVSIPFYGRNQDGTSLPPSTGFNSESGYVNTAAGGAGVVGLGSETGVATNGTRFLVWFTTPQSGVTISVSNTQTNTSGNLTTQFVSGYDINGAGGTATATPTGTTLTPGYNTLSVNANGNAYAVWEVLTANQSVPETATFGVNYAYAVSLPTTPALGDSGVQGNLAPAYTLPTGTSASATLPVPRFALNPSGGGAFSIKPCVTDLLFPFVASTATYDTGIVVANTSSDPFGTSNQAGTCTIWYYGAGAPQSQVTTSVPAGSLLAFSLQNGGTNGVTGVGFFTGYMIVQCRFQFAHGFANISDPGLKNWASGYQALVLDTASGAVNRGSNANGSPSITIRETLTN